jgi:hypothetical protein
MALPNNTPAQPGVVDRILRSDWTSDPAPHSYNKNADPSKIFKAASELAVYYGRPMPDLEDAMLHALQRISKQKSTFGDDGPRLVALAPLIKYCIYCRHGRWPEAEPYMARVGYMEDCIRYWLKLGSGHWPDLETRMFNSLSPNHGLYWALSANWTNYYDKVTDNCRIWWPEFYTAVINTQDRAKTLIRFLRRRWSKNKRLETEMLAQACASNPGFLEAYYDET